MEKTLFSTLSKIAEGLEIKYYWIVFLKYLKPIFFISFLISLLVLLISLNIEKKYRSYATIVIEADESQKIVNIEEVYSLDNQASRINNQIAILNSDDVVDYIVNDKIILSEFQQLFRGLEPSLIKRLFVKKEDISKEGLRGYLKSNFSVNNIPRSDVLELTFISASPKISKLALQNIIKSYQRYEIDSKIVITSYANEKISDRLKELTKQMESAEKNLAKYKEENNLVDTGDVKELKIKQIENLSDTILELQDKVNQYQSDLLAIKLAKGDVNQLTSIQDLMIRPEIKNIYESLMGSRNNLESLRLLYTNEHPKVKKALQTIASYEAQLVKIINDNIDKKTFELTNLKNSIDINKKSLTNATKELRDLEEKESGMLKFSREVSSSRKLYETFLQRVKETNEAQNLQISNVKIIEDPIASNTPVSPNIKKNTILAFLFSAIGVYFYLFYRDLNSSTVKDPTSLDMFDTLVLANLPKVNISRKGFHVMQMFLEDNESAFAEAVRNARTVMESKFKPNKSYLVTSSSPSEGKTTVAFNLALSLQKNYKVLLIEADIRKPSVAASYYEFDENHKGLSEILTNEVSFSDTIQKVPGTKLEFISSGKRRSDLSDIVNVAKFKKFLDVLNKKYDYVIVDSAPILPVSDTLVLAQASDYIFYVTRSNVTGVLSLMSGIKKLKNINRNVNAFILNDLDISKNSYYGYYYQQPYYYSGEEKPY
ncbi:GumC family protein [Candidatus Pelagibacter sp. HIMB1709]|uniref:GumC family protein n=1 Tax=Candidatus Pelagibacter sp. HIMB1709 TaxID=3413367 RepID=UPI003F867734